MNPDQQHVTAIFLAASEHPLGERDAFVQQACGDDPALLQEVTSLLEAHDEAGLLDRLTDVLRLPDLSCLLQRTAPGDRLGPYEIMEELGRGGMGVVFKARDVRLGRFVALKLLPPHRALDDAAKARFIAEAQAASALDHPNICTIYDADEHAGRLYLAMTYYEGETLKDRIARGPLPVEDAVDFAMQAAHGLAEAHRCNIVHRDIKPANLMVNQSGILKILDFGIAKTGSENSTHTGGLLGTIAYMSPEQVQGTAVDQRTDLWSLGVVLYEMLTGVPPFQGAHEPALLHALLYENPCPVSALRTDVPPEVEQVVRKALVRNPAMRYQHADELRGDLQRPRSASGSTQHLAFPGPGTLTFFFSDVEGSTQLLHQVGARYAEVLVDLRRFLRDASLEREGREVDTAGDGFFAVFNRARDAVAAAAAVQQAVHAHVWPEGTSVRLRIGLHTGEPAWADGSYVGLDVHRAARICSAAHGGQVLLSQATADLVWHELPAGVQLLNIGPHQLKDLPEPEQLFQLGLDGLPSRFPALGTRAVQTSNLPVQLTSFVGRQREVDRLQVLLHTARLITLTGPGGTGKTRLSLEVASRLTDIFEDGIVFVGLASITDPALVPVVVAQALDLHEHPDQPVSQTIKTFLQRRRLLLVLDNFEQVLAAASFVAEWLLACPSLTVLVTSRAPLHVSGEHEFPVPPLELPDRRALWTPEALAQQEAVALFLARARAIHPDFTLTPETARAVAEICLRLDGLPLAIELAAARVKVLSPVAIQVRLGRRFQLLTGGAQDRPARHQTLRQAIAWSYDLLNPEEQAFFRRMAVFMGGFTLDAAEQVCSGGGDLMLDPLDIVTALVDQSLLRQEEGPDGEPRFLMLETIREYGRECLEAAGELEQIRRAHVEHFLALVEQAEPELTGPRQGWWLDRLEAEHDNLRAAFAWIEEQQEAEIGLRLGAALWRFWITRGHMIEGREHLERLLALPGQATRARARALNGVATLIHELGDYATARPLLEESLAIWRTLDDQQGMAWVLNNLGWVTINLNDYATGRARSEESLALCRTLGDKRGAAVALMNIGWVTHLMGDLAAAASMLQESLALRRDIGDHRGYAFALTALADFKRQQGAYEQATIWIEEALTILRQLDDKQLVANALHVQGNIAYDLGDCDRAEALMEESVALWNMVGNRVGRAETLMDLGKVVCDQGHLERARTILEEATSIWRTTGVEWGLAWTLHGLGYVAQVADDLERTATLQRESWILFQKLGDKRGAAECLEAMGQWHATQNNLLTTVQLWSTAAALREETGFVVPPRCRVAYAHLMKQTRLALGDELFEKTWSDGRAMSPEQAAQARSQNL